MGGEMADDELIFEPAPVLNLPPAYRDKTDSYALQQYLDFLKELYQGVPLIYLLREDDLRRFLSDAEYARLKACEGQIQDWLEKCNKDSDRATLRFYPYHSPFDAMWDLKKL